MNRWTTDDIQSLKKNYRKMGSKIPNLSKKFTQQAIRVQASRLKLRKKIEWTGENLEMLKNFSIKNREIANILNIDIKAVQQQRHRMKGIENNKKSNLNKN